MAGMTDYMVAGNATTNGGVLGHLTGQLPLIANTAVWLGLFTTAPTSDSGVTGAVEPSTNAYARVQVAGQLTATSAATTVITFASVPTWIVAGMSVRDVTTPANIPANTTVVSTTGTTVTCNNTVSSVGTNVCQFSAFLPPTVSSGSEPAVTAALAQNGSVITFPQATSTGWGNIVAWGLFDAATTGNNLFWDWLGNFKWIPASVTAANPGVITTDTGDAYANGTPVVWSGKIAGNAVWTTPANLQVPVVTAGLSGITFNVSQQCATAGTGMIRAITGGGGTTGQPIAGNVTPSFAASTFIISGM